MMCYRYENSNTIFVIAKIPSYLGKKGLRNIQNWHDMQFCIYSSYIQYYETSSLQNDLLRSGLVLDQTWFVDLKFGDFGGFRWVCRLGLEVQAVKMGSVLWMNLGFSKKFIILGFDPTWY